MILAFLWFFLSTRCAGCFLGTVHFWVATLLGVFVLCWGRFFSGFLWCSYGVMVCFLVLSLSRHFGGSPLEYILLPYFIKKKKKGRKREKKKEKKLKFVSRK